MEIQYYLTLRYYNSKNYLKFEGEYLNGKRNGKGIEYQSDGDLIFEGEYLDGKKWNGKGRNIADLIQCLKENI